MSYEQQANGAEQVLRKTILLVEDHVIFSRIIRQAIESNTPYQVVHLKDGASLLDTLKSCQPDLLLLDYELPGKNGIELYDYIHAQPEWQALPVIMLSADLPHQALAQRKIVGLPKPCRISELTQAIEKILA